MTATTGKIVPLTARCAHRRKAGGTIQFVAIGDPDGTVRNAWLHPQCEQALDVSKIASVPPQVACKVCGKIHGFFKRVTYVGAPDGGVPVHPGCLAAFFDQLDGNSKE